MCQIDTSGAHLKNPLLNMVEVLLHKPFFSIRHETCDKPIPGQIVLASLHAQLWVLSLLKERIQRPQGFTAVSQAVWAEGGRASSSIYGICSLAKT